MSGNASDPSRRFETPPTTDAEAVWRTSEGDVIGGHWVKLDELANPGAYVYRRKGADVGGPLRERLYKIVTIF